MKRIKLKGIKPFLALFVLLLFNSCFTTEAVRVIQAYDQATRYGGSGTYLGNVDSYSAAYRMAESRGYSQFVWYSTTGDVYGTKK